MIKLFFSLLLKITYSCVSVAFDQVLFYILEKCVAKGTFKVLELDPGPGKLY